MNATFGPMSSAAFATWDRNSRSWKTSEDTCLWALTLSSLTLPTSGGLRNGSLFERPTPEPATSGHDSSSLPTPTADHSRGLPSSTTDYASLPNVAVSILPTPRASDMNSPGLHGQGGQDLRTTVTMLPTPRATDGPKGGPGQVNGRGVADSLPAIAALLPTPRAQDEYERRNMKTMERIRDEGGDMTLPTWAKVVAPLLPTPTAQAAKHGETPDTTANGYGSNLWDLPNLLPTPTSRDHKGANQRSDSSCLHGALLPTPKATNNENRQSLDRYGMNLGMALESIGATTDPQLPDGKPSSDDSHLPQLSLDELALPA